MAQFRDWVGDGLEGVRVLFKCENESFYCLVEDFNVVGMGATPMDAWRDTFGSLATYLFSEFLDGHSLEEARRPIPRKLHREIRRHLAAAAIVGAAQNMGGRHVRRRVFERVQMVTADQVTHAVC